MHSAVELLELSGVPIGEMDQNKGIQNKTKQKTTTRNTLYSISSYKGLHNIIITSWALHHSGINGRRIYPEKNFKEQRQISFSSAEELQTL